MQVRAQALWWQLVIVLIILMGIGLRVWHAAALPEFSFQDGARDVLVAQRLLAGQVSWEVAPASAGVIPNTPLPYWITTFWYGLAGLPGVLFWHILAGTVVMVIAYRTARLLADEQTGLVALSITAFSPELIRLSQIIWPTHAFVALYALGLYVACLAIKTRQLRWYWWSLVCCWLIQMLHSSELVIVLVVEGVLGWSLWQLMRQKRTTSSEFNGWVALVIVSWVLWLMASFGLVGRFVLTQSGIELQQLPLLSWSAADFIRTLFEYGRIVVRFVTYIFHWQFWLVVAVGWIVIGLRWKHQALQQLTTPYIMLWLLLVTMGVVVFGPSGIVSSWYVAFHSYIVVLLVSLIPYLLSRTQWQQLLVSSVVVVWVVSQNWFWLVGHLRYTIGAHYSDSEQIASKINTDIRRQQRDPTHATILLFETGDEGKFYRELAERWHTSSIQLALEELDPVYVKRVSVVPWAEHWSNCVQPFRDLYYVICPVTSEEHNCVNKLGWDSHTDVVLVDMFVASDNNPLAIYRVITSSVDSATDN